MTARDRLTKDVHGNGNPMGMGIKHGNLNGKPPQWEYYRCNGHCCGNLFPQILCCDKVIKLLVATCHLSNVNGFCAEFADYRNLMYSAPLASLCILSVRQTSIFPM